VTVIDEPMSLGTGKSLRATNQAWQASTYFELLYVNGDTLDIVLAGALLAREAD
jgi:hypothetical protein